MSGIVRFGGCGVLVVIGLSLVLGGVAQHAKFQRLDTAGRTATGKVERVERFNKNSYRATIHFQTPSRRDPSQTRDHRVELPAGGCRQGDAVQLVYDPADPTGTIDYQRTPLGRWAAVLALVGFGLACGGGGIVLLVKGRSRPDEDAASPA